jgi:AhpC/TSA family
MSLQHKLDKLKAEFESTAPAEALALIHRATQDQLASDIMAGVAKAGDRAPDFTLPDIHGNTVDTADLRRKGPVVVGFYRGIW